MLLAIDIGNSNIVIGCMNGLQIENEFRIATDLVKTSDQYCIDLKNVLSLCDTPVERIEGVIISSVVPPLLNSFRTAVMKLTGKRPMVVGPGIRTGLNIQIDNPAQIGSDLIVAAVAALREYPAPLMIVDMGTATTISVIDRSRTYIGGCICPGVRISAEALTSRAALLPGINLDEPKRAIGRNTMDCMRSGIMLGAAVMLDGLIDRMEEELGEKATVIATGGISKYVIPMCRKEILYDRNLLLKGLAILYENNRR